MHHFTKSNSVSAKETMSNKVIMALKFSSKRDWLAFKIHWDTTLLKLPKWITMILQIIIGSNIELGAGKLVPKTKSKIILKG